MTFQLSPTTESFEPCKYPLCGFDIEGWYEQMVDADIYISSNLAESNTHKLLVWFGYKIKVCSYLNHNTMIAFNSKGRELLESLKQNSEPIAEAESEANHAN